jgi:hypothetical protein
VLRVTKGEGASALGMPDLQSATVLQIAPGAIRVRSLQQGANAITTATTSIIRLPVLNALRELCLDNKQQF